MSRPAIVSPESLSQLGDGQLAYVTTIRSEDVPRYFPKAPRLKPGLKLFALHAADGTPMLVTETLEAALSNAERRELQAARVH